MRLTCVQMDVTLGDVAANLSRVLKHVRDETGGADLVVFPECALSGYVFMDREEALRASIRAGGAELQALAAACREARLGVAVGALESTSEDRLFNSMFFVDGDGVRGVYRKTHLPHMGVDRFADRGDSFGPILDIAGCRVAALICYDGTFPEPTRALALAGADLVLLPTNWPNQESEKGSYLPRTRALENVIWFAALNRVTSERGIQFNGNSSICDPSGAVVAAAGSDPAVLRAVIRPELARQKRRDTVPGELWVDRFADRRPGLYGRIME